jgi:hypothetical protein
MEINIHANLYFQDERSEKKYLKLLFEYFTL